MDKLRVSTFGGGATQAAAAERGLYEDEGLEVEVDVTQSSKDQMAKLVDGTWDVVHTNADNVVWWSEDNGADLVIVMAAASTQPADRVGAAVFAEVDSFSHTRSDDQPVVVLKA